MDGGRMDGRSIYPLVCLVKYERMDGNRAEVGSDMDRIPVYLYPYLFCLMNTNMDTDISRMQKIIYTF